MTSDDNPWSVFKTLSLSINISLYSRNVFLLIATCLIKVCMTGSQGPEFGQESLYVGLSVGSSPAGGGQRAQGPRLRRHRFLHAFGRFSLPVQPVAVTRGVPVPAGRLRRLGPGCRRGALGLVTDLLGSRRAHIDILPGARPL